MTWQASSPTLSQAPHNIQHVQRPAALFHRNLLQRFDLPEFCPHDFWRRYHHAFRITVVPRTDGGHEGNARIHRNAIQGEIATHPTGPPRRGRQRRTLDNGRRRKGKVRDEQQIADCPGRRVIVQEIKAGQLVVADGVHHRAIRAIRDGSADARLLAFQLKPELAAGTGKNCRHGRGRLPPSPSDKTNFNVL